MCSRSRRPLAHQSEHDECGMLHALWLAEMEERRRPRVLREEAVAGRRGGRSMRARRASTVRWGGLRREGRGRCARASAAQREQAHMLLSARHRDPLTVRREHGRTNLRGHGLRHSAKWRGGSGGGGVMLATGRHRRRIVQLQSGQQGLVARAPQLHAPIVRAS